MPRPFASKFDLFKAVWLNAVSFSFTKVALCVLFCALEI